MALAFKDVEHELSQQGRNEEFNLIQVLIKAEMKKAGRRAASARQRLELYVTKAFEKAKQQEPIPELASIPLELKSAVKNAIDPLPEPLPEPESQPESVIPIADRRGTKRLANTADEVLKLLEGVISEGTTLHIGHDRETWIVHLVGLGGRNLMVANTTINAALADAVGKWLRS